MNDSYALNDAVQRVFHQPTILFVFLYCTGLNLLLQKDLNRAWFGNSLNYLTFTCFQLDGFKKAQKTNS